MPLSSITAHDPLGGFHYLAMVAGSRRPIPLAATRFVVRILGNLALVTAERCFRNDEARSIEVTMTFPVPVHAALVAMSARIGERRVVAATQRKSVARETYEAAIDGGRTAVLHEEALRGIHMISVGHVPPGQEVAVLGTWAIPLAAAGDGAMLVIPTTVGDVYGRSPLADSDDLTHAAIRLEADLEVFCVSGVATLQGGRLVDSRARVALDAPIVIRVAGAAPQVLRGLAADGHTVALTIEPVAPGNAAFDGVLLLDNSGSMNAAAAGGHGDRVRVPSKHEVALRGLKSIAAELHSTDRLDIWEFNSLPRHLGLGVGAAGAAKAIARLRPPTGGTELGDAVEALLARSEGADVLLVTDGKSHALDVHGLARRGARFTVVLVGEDSLAANVGHLAALTGGQIFISSGLDLGEVLQLAIASMRGDRLHQQVIAQGEALEAAGALVGGMRVTARWSPAASATPPTAAAMPAVDPETEASHAIAAYAAWLALPLMAEEEAATLAEAEGVVCHLTSMVLVDEAGEVQDGIPAQRKVPLMSPAMPGMMLPMPLAGAPPFPVAGMPRRRAAGRAGPGMDLPSDLAIPAAVPAAAPRRGGHMSAQGLFSRGVSIDPAQQNLPIPLVQYRKRNTQPPADAAIRSRSGPGAARPVVPVAPPAPGLSSILGRVDWTGDLEALRQGLLWANLPLEVLRQLEAAARLGAVQELAVALGITAEAVAVALLARAEAASSRGAARLARAVLGHADEVMVVAAAHAAGLLKSHGRSDAVSMMLANF